MQIVSLLGFLGSTSADISSDDVPKNPLEKCPNTPNCIRIGRKIPLSANQCYKVSTTVIDQMNPEKVFYQPEEYKIESLFRVLLFRDDFIIQITKRNKESSFLYIRSASRTGFSDLWVNKRRTQRFLSSYQRVLQNYF